MAPADPPGPRGDLPTRMGEFLGRARDSLGASRSMAGTAMGCALVLGVAVGWAVLTSGGDGGGAAVAESEAASPPPSPPEPEPEPSPSVVVSVSVSPSPSPVYIPVDPEDEDGDGDESAPAPAAEPAGLPADGRYTVRQEASGLCLDWGEEPGNEEGRSVLVLGDCGDPYPDLSWDEQDEGVFQVEMDFEDATPCMTVDYGGDEDGLLVGFAGCEARDTQLWELEPAGGGYAIRTRASGMCLSVLKDADSEAGDAVAIQECDASDPEQRWTFTAD
ncbi:RICIN domain-containing protein [Glycomyces terrestris]|uniref:Ricin B lectin domain-containing protein n=1 Tax=Glycomyces terrestris TaxID=2493553 RepID=A0A426UVL6_9ACTN|nr:ricin-type beta-trefoil lectin domain protein [Glycomyces terrestris]RRR98238.1 hypothetical protein EIW28_15100 [Glycomyces terrestris]